MNKVLKTAVTLFSAFFLLAQAQAGEGEAANAGGASGSSTGVLGTVEGAVTRGAAAATRGVERGAKAGMEGLETGLKATERVTGRIVQRLGGNPASKASPYDNDRPQ